MTITITIDVHPDYGPEDVQLDKAMKALGYERREAVVADVRQQDRELDDMVREALAPDRETDTAAPANAPKPTRERGKPSPGHKRRTNAEIAEDEAAAKADPIDAAIAALTPTIEEHEVAAISTGEERVGPEDTPEDAAQDAADEAAETAAAKTGLTLDDLRNASTPYVKKFGLAAASEDVRKLLGFALAECPADKLEWAIKTLTDAVASNPLKRTAIGEAAEPAPAAATKDDVKRALMGYALKYDGQNTDPKNMPVTMVDGPKLLALLLGKECDLIDEKTGQPRAWKISDLPDDPAMYARAVAGIEEMTEKNRFGRAVVAS